MSVNKSLKEYSPILFAMYIATKIILTTWLLINLVGAGFTRKIYTPFSKKLIFYEESKLNFCFLFLFTDEDPIGFADGLKSLYEYIGNDGYNPSPFRGSPVSVDELKSELEGSVEGQLNRMNIPERCKCENEY